MVSKVRVIGCLFVAYLLGFRHGYRVGEKAGEVKALFDSGWSRFEVKRFLE